MPRRIWSWTWQGLPFGFMKKTSRGSGLAGWGAAAGAAAATGAAATGAASLRVQAAAPKAVRTATRTSDGRRFMGALLAMGGCARYEPGRPGWIHPPGPPRRGAYFSVFTWAAMARYCSAESPLMATILVPGRPSSATFSTWAAESLVPASGFTLRALPTGVLPLPSTPWQLAHLALKRAAPSSASAGA